MFFRKKKEPLKKLSHEDIHVFDILNSGDVAIDCGANVGKVTGKMLEREAEVYAFEPNPYAFAELEKRFGDKGNAHLINKGVWDRNDQIELFLHENSKQDQVKWSTGSSILSAKTNVDADRGVKIEVVDLAEFIQNLGKPVKLLKIDVEGVEFDILKRLIESGTATKIESILVETHEEKIPEIRVTAEEVKHMIAERKLGNINLNWV